MDCNRINLDIANPSARKTVAAVALNRREQAVQTINEPARPAYQVAAATRAREPGVANAIGGFCPMCRMCQVFHDAVLQFGCLNAGQTIRTLRDRFCALAYTGPILLCVRKLTDGGACGG